MSAAVTADGRTVALDEASMQKSGTATNPGYRVRLSIALARTGDKAAARREVETYLRNQKELSQKEVNDAHTVLASL